MGRWRQVIWGSAVAAVAAGAMAACAASGNRLRAGLIDYATGDWHCEIPTPEDEWPTDLSVEATVTAEGKADGEFRFTFDSAVAPLSRTFSGTWRLDGTDLDVEIPERLTTYAMGHVDLATDRIEIQEDAAGAEVQRVEVARQGDTVTFGWKDPWSGDDLGMTCTRA